MLRRIFQFGLVATLVVVISMAAPAQSLRQDYDDTYAGSVKIDRYLDAEIWTNHSDAEYYEGDNIVIHYRVNRDAFVAIYTIDTRGRVSLLFPTDPTDDNFVYGGVTYSLPSGDDDYDLLVTGPEGVEHLQIIASRERFPIPNWFHNSGLVCDWDDRAEYMDYLNSRYFVRYGGQRFAYDRAVVFVDEWEPYYYRPIYYPAYPSWAVCGNVYIDYPYGATVWIDGTYWGCAPLYLPRILVGWHTVTIYDYYGYCWESDFHVSRYNTVIFDRTVVRVNSSTRSKYSSIRGIGYKDPAKSGYPLFKSKAVKSGSKSVGSASIAGTKSGLSKSGTLKSNQTGSVLTKKYVRGSTKLVKTSRGYETAGMPSDYAGKISRGKSGSYKSTTSSVVSKSGRLKQSTRSPDKIYENSKSKSKSRGSSEYYQKKSGRSGKTLSGSSVSGERIKKAAASKSGKIKSSKSGSKSDKAVKSGTTNRSKGSKSSGTYKRSGSSKSQGSKASKSGTYKSSQGSNKSSGSSKSTGSTKAGGRSAVKSKGGK